MSPMNPSKSHSKAQILLAFFFSAVLLGACSAPSNSAQSEIEDLSAPEEEISAQENIEVDAIALPEASCTAVSSESRDEALLSSPYPPVNASDWQRGAESPLVTIVEYSDFECPACGALAPTLAVLESQYPDQLSVVFRHFPLIGSEEAPIHEKAALAVQASEAAGLQGAFWEMHDLLFERQLEWSALSDAAFQDFLIDASGELDLDESLFEEDLLSTELTELAEEAWQNGLELGLGGTPYLLINGFPYQGPSDISSLDAIIQLEILRTRQFNECPAFTLDMTKTYTATLRTEKGDVVIALLPEIAPTAVNSFVFLAENDWFDNVTFHRVLPGFMAQSGDPTGTGFGGPGYAFAVESSSSVLFDREGLLAMANSGPTSNGSQFFITYGPTEHLNGAFTIFGEVIEGMDVVESLTPRDPSSNPNLPPGDLIIDVIIETN